MILVALLFVLSLFFPVFLRDTFAQNKQFVPDLVFQKRRGSVSTSFMTTSRVIPLKCCVYLALENTAMMTWQPTGWSYIRDHRAAPCRKVYSPLLAWKLIPQTSIIHCLKTFLCSESVLDAARWLYETLLYSLNLVPSGHDAALKLVSAGKTTKINSLSRMYWDHTEVVMFSWI